MIAYKKATSLQAIWQKVTAKLCCSNCWNLLQSVSKTTQKLFVHGWSRGRLLLIPREHKLFIETKVSSITKVIVFQELSARLMILCFCCTAKPNQALVSGAELNLTEFTEQDCEGQYRVYSGVQYSHIRTGTEGSMWNTPSCFPSWVILKGYDWQ